MITKANSGDRTAVKNIWKKNYSTMDPRYLEYHFRNEWKEEDTLTSVREGELIGAVERRKYPLMFNGRVLQASVLSGLVFEPRLRSAANELELVDSVIDACEHSELLTLVSTERADLYRAYRFEPVYRRRDYHLTRNKIQSITIFGCAYDPSPLDMIKVYSNFSKRFNGFFARTLEDFKELKQEVAARSGKIVAYYDAKNNIRGYAVLLIEGREVRIRECVYLDSMALMKLVNAALQDRADVHLVVSEAEKLDVLFPDCDVRIYDSMLVRLNDAEPFSRLFGKRVQTAKEAFALSIRPLNLSELR